MPKAKLLTLIMFILFGILGIIIIVGACLKWKWLIDPSIDYSSVYSQAMVKKILGKKGLKLYTFFMGVIFIIIAAIGVRYVLNIQNNNWAF